MNSSRPYLIRAIHEWILDNEMTPHLLVDMEGEGVDVPAQQGQNGKIVLNISPRAVEGLMLGNDAIVYAKENGRGMVFSEDEHAPEPDDGSGRKTGRKPDLKIVK